MCTYDEGMEMIRIFKKYCQGKIRIDLSDLKVLDKLEDGFVIKLYYEKDGIYAGPYE